MRVSFCAKEDDRSADSVYQIKEGISINMELPLQDMPKKLLNLNHYLKGPDMYFNTWIPEDRTGKGAGEFWNDGCDTIKDAAIIVWNTLKQNSQRRLKKHGIKLVLVQIESDPHYLIWCCQQWWISLPITLPEDNVHAVLVEHWECLGYFWYSLDIQICKVSQAECRWKHGVKEGAYPMFVGNEYQNIWETVESIPERIDFFIGIVGIGLWNHS